MGVGRRILAGIVVPLLAAGGSGAFGDESSVLSVVVHAPESTVAEHWQTLRDLNSSAEILLIPEVSGPDRAFDFTRFEETLERFAGERVPVSVTVTPHVPGMPWQPVIDEEGRSYTDRQSPFDPAFLSEWERLHREFCRRYGRDERIERVYVAPPSYFGEAEYYMGPDWSRPRFLCYGEQARARFVEWLRERYGTAEGTAAAWGVDGDSWEELPLPVPRMGEPSLHLDSAWLDLLEWRVDHLADIVSRQIRVLREGFDGEVGFKFASADYMAVRGGNSAETAARCGGDPGFVLHFTNGHSLAEMKYAWTVAACYGASAVTVENDGERFTRTELAKILLNALLAGGCEFNFAHFGHLLTSYGPRRTEVAYALDDVRKTLERYDLEPTRKEMAFFHSNSAAWVRAPRYFNGDVAHVYDSSLTNPAAPGPEGFDWARHLDLPDVTGERPVADGDLEGRKVLIVPNTWMTPIRAAAYDAIEAWVAEGGVLVVFGADGYGWRIDEVAPEDGTGRVRRVAEESLPPVETGSGWTGPLPAGWEPIIEDEDGRVVAARRVVGRGAVIRFAEAIPADAAAPESAWFRDEAPEALRRIAREAGCAFSFEAESEDGDPELTMGYAGFDRASGRHLFVGGACGDSEVRFRFRPDPSLSGPVELLFVDVEDVVAVAEDGTTVEVERSRRSQRAVYRSPTHEHNLIPMVRVTTPSPAALSLVVRP